MRQKIELVFGLALLIFLASCGKDPLQPNNLVPATVDDDPNLPALDINGTRLHLETFGDPANHVIIFLHGGPGTGDYRAFGRMLNTYDGYKLTDEYFVIMYDQRGAGLSRRYGDIKSAYTYSIGELSLSSYLKDLEEIVDQYSPDQKVILFGHSWGGMHAMMYVNAHPDRVAGVILSEPGSFNAEIENDLTLSIASTNLFGEATNDIYWNHQNISPDSHEMLDYSYMNGFYNGLGPEYYHFSETDILPVYRFGAVASVNDLGPDGMTSDGTYTFDFTTNLDLFTTKVLFINGDLNEVLTPEYQMKNRAYLPNSEMKIIHNVGHDLIWIRADEHVRLIKEYLDEVLN
ncbi:MAG TPA: alpha/beta hydrolase [Bacteroidales bacterium]|nr:alpha/beta hydrolase [Bacteroidales bacterium]HRX97576.1 alpha/beta hydrolase [Bacteroidales bacterium]